MENPPIPPSARASASPSALGRARRLRRGVNLSHWFSQLYGGPGYVPAHFDTYIRDVDIALIRDMGFDHVRLPINCEPILAAASADRRLPSGYMHRMAENIAGMHRHDLAVIVDIHPEDSLKHRLAGSDAALDRFAGFWGEFAAALSPFDPERTFFELLNEPCIHDAARWHRIQNQVAVVIRAAAPDHTIVVTGDRWSLIPDLLALDPPRVSNLIANFHLYEPHVFTHQGARWVGAWATQIHGLPYPPDASSIQSLLARVDDNEARQKLKDYGAEDWNAEAWLRFVRPAVDWAKARGIPLICTEFGVYRKHAPRAARLAWLRDVSSTLSRAGIGWTMWDYAGDFAAVMTDATGRRHPDRDLLAALGLDSDCSSTA